MTKSINGIMLPIIRIVRFWPALLLILLFGLPESLLGCEILSHNWNRFAVESWAEIGAYGLSDALYLFRRKFESEMQTGGYSTASVTFDEITVPATSCLNLADCRKTLSTAVKSVWPEGLAETRNLDGEDTGVSPDPTAPLSVIISVENCVIDSLHFTDSLFYLWVCNRWIVRENLTLRVKVIDSDGIALFIDAFEVSPTIILDYVMTPMGVFFERVEKHNSIPMAVFYGALVPGEHLLLVQEDFPPDSGLPPFSAFQLPDPNLKIWDGPSIIPFNSSPLSESDKE